VPYYLVFLNFQSLHSLVTKSLALSLLEAGVLLVDNVQFALAPDDLAFRAAFLYGSFNFHNCFALHPPAPAGRSFIYT